MEDLLRGLTATLLGGRDAEAEAVRVRALGALRPRSIRADIIALLPEELIER